jgi:hypothetical protein
MKDLPFLALWYKYKTGFMPFLQIILFLLITWSGSSCGTKKLTDSSKEPALFDSIEFSTGPCFGACAEYHLRVYGNRKFKLYAGRVYSALNDSAVFRLDSTKMGYFAGSVNDTLFKRLNTEIRRMNLDSLTYKGSNCCDAPIKSFTVYYKGRNKEITAMFPPPVTYKFINALGEICASNPMTRMTDTFYRAH